MEIKLNNFRTILFILISILYVSVLFLLGVIGLDIAVFIPALPAIGIVYLLFGNGCDNSLTYSLLSNTSSIIGAIVNIGIIFFMSIGTSKLFPEKDISSNENKLFIILGYTITILIIGFIAYSLALNSLICIT